MREGERMGEREEGENERGGGREIGRKRKIQRERET